MGVDDVDDRSDSTDSTFIDDVVIGEWLSKVLNKSGIFEMVEYGFELVLSSDEKSGSVEV